MERVANTCRRQGALWSAVGLTALASVTVLLSMGAANAGRWQFSFYLLIPSGVAFAVGLLVLLVTASLKGSLDAGAIAALVAVLLIVSGGSILRPLAAWGALAIVVFTGLTYWVAMRLASVFDLRVFTRWATLGLLLINIVLVARTVMADAPAGTVDDLPPVLPAASWDTRPDVVVLILDEFGSLAVSPVRDVDEARLFSLEGNGYGVRTVMWAPYTMSIAAVPAILNGSYPIEEGHAVGRKTELRLGAISRGANRLAQTLEAVGYQHTQVESGVWMSACGPSVDTCVRRQAVDEAMGVLLRRSVFRWWYEQHWGHAFTASGLHSMTATREVLLERALNGRPDLVVSHILLPHVPYLLDSGCSLHGLDHDDYTSLELRLEGYQLQSGCVVGWLVDVLTELDRISPNPPTVVVVGDHGTDFRGQLTKPSPGWSIDEVLERFATFALYRLPEECPQHSVQATPQLVDTLIACINGEAPSLDRRHFLLSFAEGPQGSVTEYPSRLLDAWWATRRSASS